VRTFPSLFSYLYLFIYYSLVSALKYVSMDNKCENFYLKIRFEDDTVSTTEIGISVRIVSLYELEGSGRSLFMRYTR